MNDPYVLPNGTLKNKLGIKNHEELNKAEKDITFTKFLDVNTRIPKSFDENALKAIHKYIFSDIFEWAGTFRTVPIEKPEPVLGGLSLTYAYPSEISKKLKQIFKKMNTTKWHKMDTSEKSETFSKQLTELWTIHPFRDGNTRTVITFGSMFAKEHNFPLDLTVLLSRLTRQENEEKTIITCPSVRDLFVLSAVPEAAEPERLTRLLSFAIDSGHQKSTSAMKKSTKRQSASKNDNADGR